MLARFVLAENGEYDSTRNHALTTRGEDKSVRTRCSQADGNAFEIMSPTLV